MPPRARQPLAARDGRQPTPPPGQGYQRPSGQPPQLVPVQQQPQDFAQPRTQQPQMQQPQMQQQGLQSDQMRPVPSYQEPKKRGGRTALIILGAIALFIVFGAGGYYVGTLDRDEVSTDGDAVATPTTSLEAPAEESFAGDGQDNGSVDDSATDAAADDPTLADDAAAPGATTDDAMEDDATSEAEAGDGDEAQVVTVPDDSDASSGTDGVAPRRATLRNGMVYLEGAMPSREIADLAVAKAAAVVGPENVVDEYVIDPSVPFDPTEKAPIYVEEVILFEFNSDKIAEPFKPLLDLGVALMLQNPQGTLTVTTRTDAVGSEEVNLRVATDRAKSIRKYMIDKGVPEGQIKLDPRGEEGASEGDDETVAARQRRAEFLVENILE